VIHISHLGDEKVEPKISENDRKQIKSSFLEPFRIRPLAKSFHFEA